MLSKRNPKMKNTKPIATTHFLSMIMQHSRVTKVEQRPIILKAKTNFLLFSRMIPRTIEPTIPPKITKMESKLF